MLYTTTGVGLEPISSDVSDYAWSPDSSRVGYVRLAGLLPYDSLHTVTPDGNDTDQVSDVDLTDTTISRSPSRGAPTSCACRAGRARPATP